MREITGIGELMREGRLVPHHHPWPRAVVTPESWVAAIGLLGAPDWALLGLWGDRADVHMALRNEQSGEIGVVSLDCPDRQFPSVARSHPPALHLEAAIRDLFGLRANGTPEPRPWLDHGRWGLSHPLGPTHGPPETRAYEFLPAEGESLHEIAVGPVHAGIIEPGHFRFTANGETVVRLEERLGYVHKGVDGLLNDAEIDRAQRVIARVSGDSTVAYSFAFARAVEAALDIEVPARANVLRGIAAELERIANHFGDIGAIANDAAFALMHAHCGILRERVLRAADLAFGHRLMMDFVVPGGVARDLVAEAAAGILALLDEITPRFAEIVRLYDETPSLQDRTCTTGIVDRALVERWAAGGYVGRAAGRDFDSRRDLAYPPYEGIDLAVPVLGRGDVDARVWVRIREVEASCRLLRQWLETLPEGPIGVAVPRIDEVREGIAVTEAFRGDVLVWLRVAADGRITRCHARDASWFQWPLLEAAIEGNIVADFPLCNKSFNCSYSGHDL